MSFLSKMQRHYQVTAAMYEHRGVGQWQNGEYEGFFGSGLTKEGAEKMARQQAERKAQALGKTFKWLSKQDFNALPTEVKDQLKKDWEIAAKE